MIWTAVARAGTLISVGAALMELYEKWSREIKPTKIYNSIETGRYLGIDRAAVVTLLRKKKLHGMKVDGNYLIPGQEIINYLSANTELSSEDDNGA